MHPRQPCGATRRDNEMRSLYHYVSGTHRPPPCSFRRSKPIRNFLATAPPTTYLASGSRLAGYAAALCGVHCALTPLLVAAAPALALSEGIERAVWAGTVLVGAATLIMGPARTNAPVVLTFVGGAMLWAASLAGWLEPLPETMTSVAGSLILAGALLQGARVCRAATCAICADEGHADRGG